MLISLMSSSHNASHTLSSSFIICALILLDYIKEMTLDYHMRTFGENIHSGRRTAYCVHNKGKGSSSFPSYLCPCGRNVLLHQMTFLSRTLRVLQELVVVQEFTCPPMSDLPRYLILVRRNSSTNPSCRAFHPCTGICSSRRHTSVPVSNFGPFLEGEDAADGSVGRLRCRWVSD